MGQVTYKEIKNLEEVNEYIRQGNEMLGRLALRIIPQSMRSLWQRKRERSYRN